MNSILLNIYRVHGDGPYQYSDGDDDWWLLCDVAVADKPEEVFEEEIMFYSFDDAYGLCMKLKGSMMLQVEVPDIMITSAERV